VSTFTDDFNRGDGGPGNGWVTTGTVLISGNKLAISSGGYGYQQAINASGRQEAIYTIQGTVIADFALGAVIKGSQANQSGYIAYPDNTLAAPRWRIYRLATNGSGTVILSITGSAIAAGTHTVRLLYESGVLTLWANGALIGSVADSTYGAQTSAGVHAYATGGYLDNFNLLGDEAVSFTVDPSPIGNFGSTVALTFTGVATAWTPGTPGSPTFTVDHGVLSDQEVLTATTATATYDPQNFLGNATFADPSTGATCIVVVTSNPTVLPPGVGQFSDLAVAYIERSAAAETNATIVNREEELNIYTGTHTWSETVTTIANTLTDPTAPSGGSASLLAFVIQIFDLLNGGNNWGGAATVFGNTSELKADSADILTLLDIAQVGGSFSEGSLARALSGYPGGSHQDILIALAALDPATSTQAADILDEIAAARGPDLPSIRTVVDLLGELSTIAGYDLSDVLAAIEAIPPTDLTAISDKLDAIQPTAGRDLDTITTYVSNLTTYVSNVQASLDDIQTVSVYTLGSVMDAIAALAETPPSTYVGPPVWPGSAGATMGTSVALGAGGTITEAMDGVAVEIESTDADHRHAYSYAGVKAYRNIGALAFMDDEGRLEPYQALSFERAIYTPKCLAHAAGVKWFTGHGPVGTIQAWITTA